MDNVRWSLGRLGVEEWLVKIVHVMYRNARSRVKVNGTFRDYFLVQVGLHQGSVLSPFLFIIMLETLSREICLGCPEELFYVDHLALLSKTLEALNHLEAWKGTLESKGLRPNVKKTKIMIISENVGKVTIEGKFP